jgi:hypothetical protein
MMKKLFLLFLVFTSYTNAIETDVYFANGILTNEKNATANADLLMLNILIDRYAGNEKEMRKHIGKVKEMWNK